MTMRELLERVKAAKERDYTLNGLIATAVGGYTYEKRGSDRKEWYYPPEGWGRRDLWGPRALPDYTGSVDDAMALFEKVLPGWTVARMSQGDNKLWTVELREGHLTSYDKVVIQPDHWHGTTLPLAILTAVLVAKTQATP